jgi:hypothetical protein
MTRYKTLADLTDRSASFREPAIEYLRQRRLRILLVTLPRNAELNPPSWIRTPQQLVGWLMSQLTPQALLHYFADLEEVAIQASDLVLLRLARQYRHGMKALNIRI